MADEKELLLSVQDLKKQFGEREILKGISFDVKKVTLFVLSVLPAAANPRLSDALTFWSSLRAALLPTAGKMYWKALKTLLCTVPK